MTIIDQRNENPQAAVHSKHRPPAFAILTAALAFTGLLVLLYPSTAAWVTQYQQSQLIATYSGEVTELGPFGQSNVIDAARHYNSSLTGGAQVAAGERIPLSDGSDPLLASQYDQLLHVDSTGLMARLKVPAIAVDLPIYHGTDDETLLHGVGHLEGTALPVGGASTHSVLTAHRGLASAELFNNLDQVEVGDTFTIEVFGEVLTYRVTTTKVVEPHETETLLPQSGRDLVTLVTCTPLGVNSHRILITGERITPTPIADLERAGERPEIPGFPWWLTSLTAGSAVLIGFLVWASRRPHISGAMNASHTPDHVPGDLRRPLLRDVTSGGRERETCRNWRRRRPVRPADPLRGQLRCQPPNPVPQFTGFGGTLTLYLVCISGYARDFLVFLRESILRLSRI